MGPTTKTSFLGDIPEYHRTILDEPTFRDGALFGVKYRSMGTPRSAI